LDREPIGAYQTSRASGAHRDRVRGPEHRFTVDVGVLADHVGGGLVTAEELLGAQRLGHRLIEPGRGQMLGEAFQSAGHEPGRHQGAQQRRH
jgi:hypothetical protein